MMALNVHELAALPGFGSAKRVIHEHDHPLVIYRVSVAVEARTKEEAISVARKLDAARELMLDGTLTVRRAQRGASSEVVE